MKICVPAQNVSKEQADGIEINARRYRNKTAATRFARRLFVRTGMREGADFSNSVSR
jgi:hypothetical protein